MSVRLDTQVPPARPWLTPADETAPAVSSQAAGASNATYEGAPVDAPTGKAVSADGSGSGAPGIGEVGVEGTPARKAAGLAITTAGLAAAFAPCLPGCSCHGTTPHRHTYDAPSGRVDPLDGFVRWPGDDTDPTPPRGIPRPLETTR